MIMIININIICYTLPLIHARNLVMVMNLPLCAIFVQLSRKLYVTIKVL